MYSAQSEIKHINLRPWPSAIVVRALLEADGWRMTMTHRDLLGRDRATTATR